MKILILGGSGMVGHSLYNTLKNDYEIFVTLRQKSSYLEEYFTEAKRVIYFEAENIFSLSDALNDLKPEVIINSIGITKQMTGSRVSESIFVNSVFPHQLLDFCQHRGIRLITLSSDCVFSGIKGNYNELDEPDARDLYGKTKILGELDAEGSLTFRKSTIGIELKEKHGLIEWWLSETGKINGYKKAIYSGIITSELGNVISLAIKEYPELSGIWHISSKPISKYDLLLKLGSKINRRDVELQPDVDFICDRSLDSSSFYELTNYEPPSWDEMLDTLAQELLERD